MTTCRTPVAAAAALLALALPAQAQSLEEKRDRKLKESWLSNASWITDYDKAREAAKGRRKAILAFFTKSFAP